MSRIFLYNEFRSYKLETDVIESIEQNAPWFMEEYRKLGNVLPKSLLYRGKSEKYGKIHLSDPTENNRNNGTAWYNFIIDNTEAWKGYPLRSKSIICTTNLSYASTYGTRYVVIPIKADVSIGVCSEDDMWYSFNNFISIARDIFIDGGFRDFTDFEDYCYNLLDIDSPATSFEYFKTITNNNDILENIYDETVVSNYIDNIMDKDGNFFNFLAKYMTPDENNFKLLKYNFDLELPKENEVWTDSKCLLIERNMFRQAFGAF